MTILGDDWAINLAPATGLDTGMSMFYFCSMPSEADIAAQRQLSELTELSLAAAREVQGALQGADTQQLIGLVDAMAKIGRCVRMSIALAARLRSGKAFAPAGRESRDLAVEEERDESAFIEERPERPERLDRENLFDRLPAGDLDTQVATVARMLTSATKVLPAGNAYRARCETLIAGARRGVPRRSPPPDAARSGPARAASGPTGLAIAPNRSRGPPRALD